MSIIGNILVSTSLEVRNIKKFFFGNLLFLTLVFLAGGIVENRFQAISLMATKLNPLVGFMMFQIPVLWALALTIGSIVLVALGFKISQIRRTATSPRKLTSYHQLAAPTRKQERQS